MYILTGENDALKIHFQHGVIDAHCDTVQYFTGEKGPYDFERLNKIGHIDLPRLKSGGVKVQIFALYIEKHYRQMDALNRCLTLLDCYTRTLSPLTEHIETIYSADDVRKIKTNNKIASVLLVEGREALEGCLKNLNLLFRLGVRGIGLTWNYKNEIAEGVWEQTAGEGLTAFGKEVILEMNRLGMLVDLSHIGKKGYDHVIGLSKHPVIVSHANAKAVCDHPRNLSDEQLQGLKENGGVVGLTFSPDFVHKTNPSLETLLDHFEHIFNTVGVDFVGIGSDYDGISKAIEGLNDVSLLPNLTRGLLSRGFSKDDIFKILYGNFERVLERVLPA